MSRTYLLDVNLLIALTNPNHLHHQRAHHWFATVKHWATTPTTEAAFIRLMLNPTVAGRPYRRSQIVAQLAALRAWPGHQFLADDASLAEPVVDLAGLVGHRQVTDFQLVNLAAGHQLVLATLDQGISSALVPADQNHVELV